MLCDYFMQVFKGAITSSSELFPNDGVSLEILSSEINKHENFHIDNCAAKHELIRRKMKLWPGIKWGTFPSSSEGTF